MNRINKKCDLRTCSMCRGCQPEWLKAIDSNRKMLHFYKNDVVFKEGDTVKGMYFIYSGFVKVHKQWGDEKELILRFAKQGAIVGHRGLGDDTIYPVSATTLSPADICFVDLDFYTATLKVNPGYLFELMMFFASELKESEKRMRNLAHMNTKGRIGQALLTLQKKFGKDADGFIDIDISRQDLASYSGTTYETLFKMLNELAEESSIRLNGKKIQILTL
ncbi:MAG TPA: Crp/Fnr family transcriptional regulator [Chitinophagaceae bacterium]|nr:Crp/Fnr family transcriptional regulator [Chitinophagaceae bacterium]